MSSEDYQKDYESIVGTLRDGRTIVRAKEDFIVFTPPHYCQISVTKLNRIDAILDINIRGVSPKAIIYGICDKTITRHATGGYPVVGFTVGYIANGITATGTTVTPEIVVLGW